MRGCVRAYVCVFTQSNKTVIPNKCIIRYILIVLCYCVFLGSLHAILSILQCKCVCVAQLKHLFSHTVTVSSLDRKHGVQFEGAAVNH